MGTARLSLKSSWVRRPHPVRLFPAVCEVPPMPITPPAADYWMSMFSGEFVYGEKIAAIMAQWAGAYPAYCVPPERQKGGCLARSLPLMGRVLPCVDVNHVPGVAYHPDRYIDESDEMRARCWFLFDTIDGNHDETMCDAPRLTITTF
jgi:hypothetical protein|eukprot:COSAG01_NODE_138_length_24329_cov_45.428229_16_plen_148_part_00